ncbi:hypothetical protein TNCV_3205521 [Trichonephila clavipes]|nr:hypothetical protein TNCV_3205521 [Trichonephila clavipes]
MHPDDHSTHSLAKISISFEYYAKRFIFSESHIQDLTFDDCAQVDTDIAVRRTLFDAEIVALDHNNTLSQEDESEELTPINMTKA